MTMQTTYRMRQDLLAIYLNDHLAGATLGTSLAQRMKASAKPGSEQATVLNELATEITDDRSTLLQIMATLGIQVRGYKVLAARAGEKAGRLKLNGSLLARSPLSDLEEAEFLLLGVNGKAAGWRTLRKLADRDNRLDAELLDNLIARANRQVRSLESLQSSAADQVMTTQAR